MVRGEFNFKVHHLIYAGDKIRVPSRIDIIFLHHVAEKGINRQGIFRNGLGTSKYKYSRRNEGSKATCSLQAYRFKDLRCNQIRS